MNKNQKGFSVVEILILVFVIIVLGVIGLSVLGKNNKTSGKSTVNTKQTSTIPVPKVLKTHLWSGYVKHGPSNSMTSVTGQWTVPSIVSATSSPTYKLSNAWIGIGGTTTVGKLIQIGTNQIEGPGTDIAGPKYYIPFWECAPDPNNIIFDLLIKPGDVILANIAKEGSSWSLELANKTNGQSFQKTVDCGADQSTAEWILEDQPQPGTTSGSLLPKISSTTFNNIMFNGRTLGLTDLDKLIMADDNQTIAVPSNLSDNGQSFTVSDVRK